MSSPPDGLDLSALRETYRSGELTESMLAADWLTQFETWFAAAAATPAVVEANAMQLATVDGAGRPGVRTVLAKSVTAQGVTFYTNYDSAKGHQLANGSAAAVFSWLPLQRQVRVRGAVGRVSREVTEQYFAGRPRGSQVGAWASPQSQVLTGRAELDERVAAIEQRFADGPLPAPPDWGGYLLEVEEIEFWQGRDDRLHDRLRFRLVGTPDGERGPERDAARWAVERLAP